MSMEGDIGEPPGVVGEPSTVLVDRHAPEPDIASEDIGECDGRRNDTECKESQQLTEERSRKGKAVVRKTAFERLPAEIITHILYLADPNTFASLALLNSEWRLASETIQLYVHQLSHCHNYLLGKTPLQGPFDESDLPRLRQQFALEAKRNLFESYIRPKETVVKLISTSAVSSTAFPGGEAFHFSFSPRGRLVLAHSSSRIFIIDVSSADVSVKREFKILRRPVSVAILDDATLLAVLSTDLQVNLYDLTGPQANFFRTISLDNPPRTIALSPGGSVLAAAYDGGIEVYSLAPLAVSTDRRAVKCDAVDSLSFSADGTLLLGTTLHSPNPSTVILSAPFYSDGGLDIPVTELLSQLWTTQILFPNSSRDCSHATLLPYAAEGEATWTFTHDRVFETFRAVRVDDLRNGTTYFTGPTTTTSDAGKILPSTLPSASDKGELVAAGFVGQDIWLYGVPTSLDYTPDISPLCVSASGEIESGSFSSRDEAESEMATRATLFPSRPQSTVAEADRAGSRVPQWQILCDKFRNVFVGGRQIASVDGLSALRWVSPENDKGRLPLSIERLVAVAPGGVDELAGNRAEGMVPVDGGRVIMFDFERSTQNGEKRVITIEVGEGEAELLEEETRDIEAEVALVRRRTVAQRKGSRDHRASLGRSATALSTTSSAMSNRNSIPILPPTSQKSHVAISPAAASEDAARRAQATFSPADDDLASFEEVQDALDLPYSHTNPRSRTSLQRAATAAAANRRHNPPRVAESGQVSYLRADGRRDPPHESDADNWVPPPPPYTPNAEAPLPEHLLLTLLPRRTEPSQRVSITPSMPARAQTTLEGMTQSALQRTRSTLERAGNSFRARRTSFGRMQTDPESTNVGHQPDETHANPTPLVRIDDSSSQPLPRPNAIPRRPVGAAVRTRSAEYIEPRSTELVSSLPESFAVQSYLERSQGMRSISRSVPPLHHPRSSSLQMLSSALPAGHSTVSRQQFTAQVPWVQHVDGIQPAAPSTPGIQLTPATGGHAYHLSTTILPSAEQLATLQNRHSESTSPNSFRPISSNFNNPSRPSNYTQHSPRAAQGAPVRTAHPPGLADNGRRSHRNSFSRGSSSPSLPDANFRRPETLSRLDTIHSIPSRAASARSRSRELGSIPRRQPSRAERSAAINIQEAKRRGWGKKSKKRKGGSQWGESSAGWTDVTEGSNIDDDEGSKKGAKCTIM